MSAPPAATATRPAPVRRVLALGRRVPVPLRALLAAVAVLGVVWAFVTPAWQAPDENAHFGYMQSLAERLRRPFDPRRPAYSTEQRAAENAVNALQVAGSLETKPEWSRSAWERWRARHRRLDPRARTDAGGAANPASANPPLYYLYEFLPYRLAIGGDPFARLLALRLWSIPLLMLTAAAAWLLAGEVFGRDRLLQLAAAAVAGLWPMATFIASALTPDALLYGLWTLALWLGVRIAKRGLTPAGGAAFLGVAGLAMVTKQTSLALLPASAWVLAASAWRLGRSRRLYALQAIGASLVAFALPVGAWLASLGSRDGGGLTAQVVTGQSLDLRGFASYLWQFYLPTLPTQTAYGRMMPYPLYDIWVKTSSGAFGWLEIMFAEPLYALLALVMALVAGGAVVALWRTRGVDPVVVGFLALAALTLVAGLHWTEYGILRTQDLAFSQGRYLFPLIGIAGLAVAKALTLVSRPSRASALALVLGGLVVLQLYSVSLVIVRFYA